MSEKKDFFISYTGKDESWAVWIAYVLEGAGYTTVIQVWDFRPRENFVLKMDEALKQADCVMALLSPDYLESPMCKSEWTAAFREDPTGDKGGFLSVRISDCDVEGLLGPRIYIDLVGLPDKIAAENVLLAGVKKGRAKPDHEPTFPGGSHLSNAPPFPGGQPPIWNIVQPVPCFVGREDLTKRLHKTLNEKGAAALTQAAVHGLGGVGKSQLAIHYAHDFAHEYGLVWWIKSEQETTLYADYAKLALRLGLVDNAEENLMGAYEAVKERLERGDIKFLLIFDNAEKLEDIQGFVPERGKGHILITSRDPNWGGMAETLRVDKLRPKTATEFLLQRTGREEEDDAKALAKDLDHLPLALEQAAAYICENGVSLAEYSKLFAEHHLKVLERGKVASKDYNETIATTWETSLQKIEETQPAAAKLLNFCAFLAPDAIPLDVLRAELADAFEADLTDDLVFNETLAALTRYSLVEVKRDDGKIDLSLHRLVQEVLRDRMSKESSGELEESALTVMSHAFNMVQQAPETWLPCQRLAPHAQMVLEWCRKSGVEGKKPCQLLSRLGAMFEVQSLFSSALAVLKRALDLAEGIYGPEDEELIACIANLGRAHDFMGEFDLAIGHLKRASKMAVAIWGEGDTRTALNLSNLGDALQGNGQLSEAKEYCQRGLDSAEASKDQVQVAYCANSLGLVLQALEDFPGAQHQLERALQVGEDALGAEHPYVGQYAASLGRALAGQGDLPTAKTHLQRAVKIGLLHLGAENLRTKDWQQDLNTVLKALNDSP